MAKKKNKLECGFEPCAHHERMDSDIERHDRNIESLTSALNKIVTSVAVIAEHDKTINGQIEDLNEQVATGFVAMNKRLKPIEMLFIKWFNFKGFMKASFWIIVNLVSALGLTEAGKHLIQILFNS